MIHAEDPSSSFQFGRISLQAWIRLVLDSTPSLLRLHLFLPHLVPNVGDRSSKVPVCLHLVPNVSMVQDFRGCNGVKVVLLALKGSESDGGSQVSGTRIDENN